MNKVLIVVSLFLTISTAFAQGRVDGFFNGKGNATAVFGLGFEDTKNYFIGTERSNLSRSLYYVNLYGTYGITNNLDISLSLPFISSNKNSNLQDISLYLKHRALTQEIGAGKLQLTLAAGFSTPVSNYATGGLNDIGQQATIIDTRGLIHYQFDSGWFTTLQSGYSFKLKETPNSIPFTLKVGKATKAWYYDLFYDFQHSFGGIDYRGTPRPQNFKEFGVDFHKVGGSIYRSFSENFGGYVSLSYVLSGRNVFQGPGYGLGLVYNFKKN